MNTNQPHERNWALVVVASIVIVLSSVLFVFAVTNIVSLGWWALAIVLGSLSSIILAITAIKKNDPSWLLLDLLLPS